MSENKGKSYIKIEINEHEGDSQKSILSGYLDEENGSEQHIRIVNKLLVIVKNLMDEIHT